MNNFEKIQVWFLIVTVAILVVSYAMQVARKQIEEKERFSIFLAEKKKNYDIFLWMFEFLIQWPVTKAYVKKIEMQYKIIMPGDKKSIAKKTMSTILIICTIDLLVIFLLFALKPSLFQALLTIAYIYIANNHVIFLILEYYSIKLLKQTDELIVYTSDFYNLNSNIEDALSDAIFKISYPINLHANAIHKVITSEDIDKEEEYYIETAPNKYIKIFLSLSKIIFLQTDKKVNGESLYIKNMKYLRQDIKEEVLKREKMSFLLTGLVPLAVLPILFVDVIKERAIGLAEEVSKYYDGAFGLLMVFLIFLFTVIVYSLLQRLKETKEIEIKNYTLLDYISKKTFINTRLDNILNKNYGKTLRIQELLKKSGESITVKQFLLKRILYSFITFLVSILLFFGIHDMNKRQVYNTSNLKLFNSSLSEEQIQEIRNLVVEYIDAFKGGYITVHDIEMKINEEGIIKSKELATMTANEIVNRINSYRQEYFKWYELVISLYLSILAYYLPYIFVKIFRKYRQMQLHDETVQNQSIILMLMHMDKMTVDIILEWLENYANIFKDSIQMCINDLRSGDLEAFDKLKENEPFEPFVKIIDKLQLCDSIEIYKAFHDIEIERNNYHQQRKLDNEIIISNKINFATFIAWIPFILTAGIYLIVPLVIEGLTQIISYFRLTNK